MNAPRSTRPISIAIAAMGGQGGGTLSNWVVDLAERNGYYAQVTSVPGVAQRTGATVNYVEIMPEAAADDAGRAPVLALMPVPGDVDIVIAGELVEAGRAIQRGIVTPDRTTLIASSHRFYAYSEKSAMSDGRIDSDAIVHAGERAARQFIHFDMESIAQHHHTVISAVLFGALAGAATLPFAADAFTDTIRRGGKAVDASIAGFQAGFDIAQGRGATPSAEHAETPVTARHPKVQALLARADAELPDSARATATEGLRRLIDYQSPAYADRYLDRLTKVYATDQATGGAGRDWALTTETAKHLALWMSYEDTIRVADLKTRSARFARYRKEVRAEDEPVVHVTEFMHPRVEEICDTLPHWLGSRLLASDFWRRLISRLFGNAREVRTSRLGGFLMLYVVGRMRGIRPGTYRFRVEQTKIDDWLARIDAAARIDNTLALEIARCQRLIKGYGDTHERGSRNYQTIVDELDRRGLEHCTAQWVKTLRDAALADEYGNALQATLSDAA